MKIRNPINNCRPGAAPGNDGPACQRARSKRVISEEIVQERAPDLNSYGRWARGIDIRAAADAGAAMAVVLKEQLELRPSLALQKKVGLKSLEQVIRWGDRVNQELRRWRKLEDKKCWRARARCIRKKSRGGSSRLSGAISMGAYL